MSYKALYRQWRPSHFDEMVGQQHVTKVLKNQIQSGQTGHAYLFCGTRGTGKTSAAKIFAKGVNCLSEGSQKPCGKCENCISIKDEQFMDIIEIDAASNNGVDNIRELKESIKYPPAKGRYKVYIIDEVHMLSTGAFNALLKTLEEPPEYIKFILATTEVHKLPSTILSRCQKFDFKRISEQDITSRMSHILNSMEVKMDVNALAMIARNAEGSARDALSILDQCISLGAKEITREAIIEVLGTVDDDFMLQLTSCVAKGETAQAVLLINEMIAEGKDIQQFIKDWIYHYRNLLMSKISQDLEAVIAMSSENIKRLKELGEEISMPAINNAIMELSKTAAAAKYSSQPRILLELVIVKLSHPNLNDSIEGVLERISQLESALASGQWTTQSQSQTESSLETKKPQVEQEYLQEETIIEVEATEKPQIKGDQNYDKLWQIVIDEAKNERPSLTMFSQGVNILNINKTTVTLYVESEGKKEYLLRNKDVLEELFQKHTSMSLKVECQSEGSGPIIQQTSDDEEIREKLIHFIGTDQVTIVE